jgi:hypothetical protein
MMLDPELGHVGSVLLYFAARQLDWIFLLSLGVWYFNPFFVAPYWVHGWLGRPTGCIS